MTCSYRLKRVNKFGFLANTKYFTYFFYCAPFTGLAITGDPDPAPAPVALDAGPLALAPDAALSCREPPPDPSTASASLRGPLKATSCASIPAGRVVPGLPKATPPDGPLPFPTPPGVAECATPPAWRGWIALPLNRVAAAPAVARAPTPTANPARRAMIDARLGGAACAGWSGFGRP